MELPKNGVPSTWGEGEMSIYRAALTGFIANKDFHGGQFQGSTVAAHEFAMMAVFTARDGNFTFTAPVQEG